MLQVIQLTHSSAIQESKQNDAKIVHNDFHHRQNLRKNPIGIKNINLCFSY